MTHDQLAEASGLTRRNVIRLQNGERLGTLGSWYALARGLGMSTAELLAHLDDADPS